MTLLTWLTALNRGIDRLMRSLIYALLAISGAGILVMIAVTCADVLLRLVRHPFVGAYDIVRIAGILTLGAGLPYTTAVKGHVAIEYFFHKLGRRSRIAVDTVAHILVIGLFGFLTWRCALYGASLYRNGQVSQTLEIPIYWTAYIVSLSCGMVTLITAYHMIHPGKELIKP